MHNENEAQKIKDRVLDAIRTGKTSMRPKWHFILKGALFATGILIMLLVALCLVSFAIFSMRETGTWPARAFNIRELLPLFHALPVTLILLSLVFIGLLETLVRRYSFAYRTPLLYSLIAILALVITASVFMAPFHRAPFQAARKGKLRVGGQFYRQFGVTRTPNIRHGTVESLTENGFILRDIENATSLVIISPETHIPASMTFSIGRTVTIFGIETKESIEARGVRADSF